MFDQRIAPGTARVLRAGVARLTVTPAAAPA